MRGAKYRNKHLERSLASAVGDLADTFDECRCFRSRVAGRGCFGDHQILRLAPRFRCSKWQFEPYGACELEYQARDE